MYISHQGSSQNWRCFRNAECSGGKGSSRRQGVSSPTVVLFHLSYENRLPCRPFNKRKAQKAWIIRHKEHVLICGMHNYCWISPKVLLQCETGAVNAGGFLDCEVDARNRDQSTERNKLDKIKP